MKLRNLLFIRKDKLMQYFINENFDTKSNVYLMDVVFYWKVGESFSWENSIVYGSFIEK